MVPWSIPMTRLLYNSADHLLSARHRQYAEPRPPNPQAPKPHHPHDAMAQHESHVEKSHMPHEVSAVTARRLSKPFEGSLPLSRNPRERASATTRDEFRARTPPSKIESSLVGFASIADALRPRSPPRARAVVREREATTLTRQPRFEIPTGSPRLHVARGIHRQEPHPEGDHQALQVHRTGRQERHVPPRHHRVQGLDPRQDRGLEDPRSLNQVKITKEYPVSAIVGKPASTTAPSSTRCLRVTATADLGPWPPPPLPTGGRRIREGAQACPERCPETPRRRYDGRLGSKHDAREVKECASETCDGRHESTT